MILQKKTFRLPCNPNNPGDIFISYLPVFSDHRGGPAKDEKSLGEEFKKLFFYGGFFEVLRSVENNV